MKHSLVSLTVGLLISIVLSSFGSGGHEDLVVSLSLVPGPGSTLSWCIPGIPGA